MISKSEWRSFASEKPPIGATVELRGLLTPGRDGWHYDQNATRVLRLTKAWQTTGDFVLERERWQEWRPAREA